MTDVAVLRPPAWERLRAPASGRLAVGRLERRSLAVLRVVEGDLPDCEGATLFWIERLPDGGYRARAARIDGEWARPMIIDARRLEADDPAVARLLGASTPLGAERAAPGCSCEALTESVIAGAGRWGSVDGAKRATKAAFGACQGRRCVAGMAATLGIATDDPRSQITARPPLVPLPAILLAAFAAER